MKRYDTGGGWSTEAAHGKWVLYEDSRELVATLQAAHEMEAKDLKAEIAALKAELAALKASHITPCRWEQDMDGNWQTGCDNLYSFIDGTPTENGTKYCPFCGHHVEVHNVD